MAAPVKHVDVEEKVDANEDHGTDSTALLAGWLPFAVVLVLTLVFSYLYVRAYQHRRLRETSVTVVATFGLCAVLLTALLVPVDVFLVSFMKFDNGTFQTWAADNDTRREIQNSILYSYYGLYSCVLLFAFFLIPFAYFYHEEREEDDENVNCSVRSCAAFKFTIAFVLVAAILLIVGAVIPLKGLDAVDRNSSEWKKFEHLLNDLASTTGENALSFTMSCLSIIGMLSLVSYTSYGMSTLSVGLIRGSRSAKSEQMEVKRERSDIIEEIDFLKNKESSGRRLSSRDRSRLANLADQERLMARREKHLNIAGARWCVNACAVAAAPLRIVAGVAILVLAFLVFVSMVIGNIDKALNSVGYEVGYALSKPKLPNPIDISLVFLQQVFPLDYIAMFVLVMFFVLATMSGIRNLGLRCFCINLYRIRPSRTRPQAILLVVAILTFVVITLNVILYSLAPQYVTYGHQFFVDNSNTTGHPGNVVHCSTDSPPDACVMTRMATLLLRYFFKAPFFGACYYWGSWIFSGLFPLGLLVTIVRRRRSAIDGVVEDSDFEDSDEEDEGLIRA